MQDLKIVIFFLIIIGIVNLLYSYYLLNKRFKSYLLIEFRNLAISLGYSIIEDKNNYSTKIIKNEVILGTDIDFQLDISKLTELIFIIVFNKSNENIFRNNTIEKFTKFIFKFNFIISIFFSLGFLLNIVVLDEGPMMPVFFAIILLGITSLIFFLS